MQSKNQKVTKKAAILLYKASKPKRGTAFEIYSNETLVVKTTITKPGIHIPKRALLWMKVGKEHTILPNKVSADLHIEVNGQKELIIRKQEFTITEETNGWYVKCPKTNEQLVEIFRQRGRIVTCTIQGLQPTKTFYKASEQLEQVTIEIDSKQLLVSGGSRGTIFDIYQTGSGLQIECKVTMDQSGRIELSDELGRHIKNLHLMKDFFVVGKLNDEGQIVMEMITRKKGKRIIKRINLPYYGQRNKINLIFSHTSFELTEKTERDLKITHKVQRFGYPVNSISSKTSL